MALPSIWWLNKAADAFRWIAPLAGSLLSFILFITGIFKVLIFTALDALADAIAQIELSTFGSANFSILQGIGYINAVFPLSETIVILLAYYTAWGTVVSIRWVKSFIPTVAN